MVEITNNEVALAKSGDPAARESLLSKSEALICWWMKRIHWAGPFEDGMQEGRVGVLEALKRFDADRGAKFTTYAGWWIRQAIESAMGQSPIPVEEVPEVATGCESVVDAVACFEVAEAVKSLSEDEAHLLRWRFYQDESLEQIGKRLGIHKFSASIKIEKILAKVRGEMAVR